MKNIRNILLLIAISFVIGISNVYAGTLTIDNKSYDENTKEFIVSGTSSYNDVMVSLFDGDNLVSFKTTVITRGNRYSVSFNVSFSEDKTITIKVGDIDSTEYEIDTLDVKKTVEPVKPNKLTDEHGSTLTMLDDLMKFDFDDILDVQLMTDLTNLPGEDREKIDALQNAIGGKKKVIGVMIIGVYNNDREKELEETNGKYELFLNIPEDMLKDYKKPYAARLIDEEKFELEEGKKLIYDSSNNGIALTLNNIGVYILYDDVTVTYKFLDKTDSQTYYIDSNKEIVFKVDASKDKFVSLYIDDKKVDEKNYSVKEGSTIITLKADYLNTLIVGDHIVKVDYTDGEATGSLTVKKEASNVVEAIAEVISNPSTGDKIIISIALVLVGAIGLGITLKNSKKKHLLK